MSWLRSRLRLGRSARARSPLAPRPRMEAEYFVVSWSVDGIDLSGSYPANFLFGPALEDEAITFLEWLVRGLARDGFKHLTIAPQGGLGRSLRVESEADRVDSVSRGELSVDAQLALLEEVDAARRRLGEDAL